MRELKTDELGDYIAVTNPIELNEETSALIDSTWRQMFHDPHTGYHADMTRTPAVVTFYRHKNNVKTACGKNTGRPQYKDVGARYASRVTKNNAMKRRAVK